MIYQGHVINGAIVLDERVDLPEGAAVQIQLAPAAPTRDGEAARRKSMAQEIAEIAAQVPATDWERLPQDLSDQLDHYIYGTARQ